MRLGRSLTTCRGRSWWQRVGMALLIIGASLAMGVPLKSWAVSQVEVRNLGLSRLGGRTMLTVILNQAANPQISSFTGVNRSQLVVEFPQAHSGKLPARLAGDDTLVKSVRTEVSGAGVKIILEMVPDRPYTTTREIRPLPGGLAMFRLGLEADSSAAQAKRPPAAAMPEPQEPLVTQAPEAAAPPPETAAPAPETTAPAPEPTAEAGPAAQAPTPAPMAPTPPPEATAPPSAGVAPTGTFAELNQLIPQAKGLLEFLRADGWRVAQAKSYDRAGQRFSRGFHLTNSRYPEFRIKIAHLPPNAPAAPYINILDFSMEGLTGRAADEYRTLKQWNFRKIKTRYEDIGDFFDEALKPLRVDLRQQCQRLAIRHADFLTKFLQQAVPQNPKVAEQAMTHIRQKVNPRFEGVQYTLSENPLVILNLVDFLYVRIYYISGH